MFTEVVGGAASLRRRVLYSCRGRCNDVAWQAGSQLCCPFMVLSLYLSPGTVSPSQFEVQLFLHLV